MIISIEAKIDLGTRGVARCEVSDNVSKNELDKIKAMQDMVHAYIDVITSSGLVKESNKSDQAADSGSDN